MDAARRLVSRDLRIAGLFVGVVGALALAACSSNRRPGVVDLGGNVEPGDFAVPPDLATPPAPDLAEPFDPDAACAVAEVTTKPLARPVDIIWVVDNSSSMQPAVQAVKDGLNDFATLIGGKSLDYHIVMLSLRDKQSPITVGGGTRYPVCIPPPLAGGTNCEDGPRFHQTSLDVRSTQPLEQLLGTLAQTTGYQPGDARGGDPWASYLRSNATKTVVVVTDDNSRFSADQFEHFAGGKNPFTSTTELPPGVLEPVWNGLFTDYTFSSIYGWGSATDPTVTCSYTNGSSPPSPGPVYTELVSRTHGVRAQICDASGAWSGFFQQVAQAVVSASKLDCDVAIPAPPNGMTLDPALVNVTLDGGASAAPLAKVAGASACGAAGGWYYDDPVAPARVLLCPSSCGAAQALAQTSTSGASLRFSFGCATIIQ